MGNPELDVALKRIMEPGFGETSAAVTEKVVAGFLDAETEARARLERAEAEITACRAAREAIDARYSAATREQRDAAKALNLLVPHPLAGQKVKKTVPHQAYLRHTSAQKTIRGTVKMRGGGYRSFKNHHPREGQWYVESASGLTAYALDGGWELDTPKGST